MAEYPGAAWAGVSPNRSDRQGRVKLFIVHHYAGTQGPDAARARFMAPNDRSVSPNYQVNADGSVYEIVPPDRYRAWTTGAIDHQAVTCETQNTSGAPSWGISRESHEAIAHLIAWASQRYGFPIQRGRVDAGNVVAIPGVVGHRETPAGKQTGTACPGPSMDLDWLVARARQIASGEPAAVIIPPIGETPMYILALNAGTYARAGVIYTNDVGGHWRGVSNLEGNGYILPLAAAGKLPYVEFNGSDLDLLFAMNGVWEQETIDPAKGIKWRNGTVALMGLGAMTGRLMYPGSDSFHFPKVDDVSPDVPVTDEQTIEIAKRIAAAIGDPAVPEVDYEKIATTVRDEFAARPLG